MSLTKWARLCGVHPQAVYLWFHGGTLPVPSVNPRSALVAPDAVTAITREGGLGLYARVSSHDQKADPGRQVARIEAEVGSGMNGTRSKVRRLLADPRVRAVVVERRGRLGRVDTELVEAALSAHGRRLMVLDPAEVEDDLVWDMTEILRSFCARLYGRRSARNRVEKALRCAARGVGPASPEVTG